MRAGRLTDILTFHELQKTRTPSGAVEKAYVKILTARGERLKLTAVVDKDGINASELFIGNMIVFRLRYNPLINDNQRVEYQGRKYSIQLIDKYRNELKITLNRIND